MPNTLFLFSQNSWLVSFIIFGTGGNLWKSLGVHKYTLHFWKICVVALLCCIVVPWRVTKKCFKEKLFKKCSSKSIKKTLLLNSMPVLWGGGKQHSTHFWHTFFDNILETLWEVVIFVDNKVSCEGIKFLKVVANFEVAQVSISVELDKNWVFWVKSLMSPFQTTARIFSLNSENFSFCQTEV